MADGIAPTVNLWTTRYSIADDQQREWRSKAAEWEDFYEQRWRLDGIPANIDVTITWLDLVAPGGTEYRPLWVSVGVLSMWLMVFVTVTATWRKHMGARFWKTVHLASYGVFVTATAHGLMAGTDSGKAWIGLDGLIGGRSSPPNTMYPPNP